ncbi:MAG: hypothetical protein ACJ79O_26885, partial [Myxococcales bacterium]
SNSVVNQNLAARYVPEFLDEPFKEGTQNAQTARWRGGRRRTLKPPHADPVAYRNEPDFFGGCLGRFIATRGSPLSNGPGARARTRARRFLRRSATARSAGLRDLRQLLNERPVRDAG